MYILIMSTMIWYKGVIGIATNEISFNGIVRCNNAKELILKEHDKLQQRLTLEGIIDVSVICVRQ